MTKSRNLSVRTRDARMITIEIVPGIGYFGGARMDLTRSRVKDQEVALGTKFEKLAAQRQGFRELTTNT